MRELILRTKAKLVPKKGTTLGYLAQDQGLDSQQSIWGEMDSVFADLHEQEAQIHSLEQKNKSIDTH
nr:hypothetical protein [Paucilactobacillus hokkaidonensis]